jgi:Flp pilus assembly protein TadD
MAAMGFAALLLAGCQSASVDRKLDGYVMSSARNAEANHDYGAAAAHYASLYDAAHPDAGVAIGMARNLRYAGRIGEAIGVLEDAVRQLGVRPDLLVELGKQHVAGGKPDLAVDPLLQPLASRPPTGRRPMSSGSPTTAWAAMTRRGPIMKKPVSCHPVTLVS